MIQPDRDDNHVHYEAVTDRNRERLGVLHALSDKSPWKHLYKPIRPRDLSATLLNAFRLGIRSDTRQCATGQAAWREQLSLMWALALRNSSDARAARAIEYAIYEARHLNGLMDPERRSSYPSSAADPDPQLSPEEHLQIENILRAWLLDALSKFSSKQTTQGSEPRKLGHG